MKPETTQADPAICMAAKPIPSADLCSPQHLRQLKLRNRTDQVCDHVEMFSVSRGRKTPWQTRQSKVGAAGNALRNATIRKYQRAVARQDWQAVALLHRQHPWLVDPIPTKSAAAAIHMADRPHHKPLPPPRKPEPPPVLKEEVCPFVVRTANLKGAERLAEIHAEYNRVMAEARRLMAAGKMRAFYNLVAKHKSVMLGDRPTI